MTSDQASTDSEYREFSDFSNGDYSSYSWTIHSDSVAIKKSDRSVFLHHGTGIPHQIRGFFAITGLKAGEKKEISLWNGNTRFNARLEMTTHDVPRSRMIWYADFVESIQTSYPKWYDFFHAGGVEADETPSIKFSKRSQVDEYTVDFLEGRKTLTTSESEIVLKPGIILNNSELMAHFKVSPQGGMRRGKRTNSLVLITDHTKTVYDDKWKENILHYTGMGLRGDQKLTFNQNKTLAASRTNGVQLHLFEVFEEGKYVYAGEVELAGDPYEGNQLDEKKDLRKVYIFPLKVKDFDHAPTISKELIEKKEAAIRKKVRRLPLSELALLAHTAQPVYGTREVTSEIRERNAVISEYAKRLAEGICQLCDQPAPFNNRDNEPFLETHHIIPLAKNGVDNVENVVALCPNCHRKMHVLNLPTDVAKLKATVAKQV